MTDDKLWEKLEELELKEELENELAELKDSPVKEQSILIKDLDFSIEGKKTKSQIPGDHKQAIKNGKKVVHTTEQKIEIYPDSKHELLQKVLDKQNELEEKLVELKNKNRSDSETEKDLLKRLDEIEELDNLEDEMDR